MKQLLDKISLPMLAFPALLLAILPFTGPSHLLEKLNMLMSGNLSKPIDVFDFFMHATPLTLLIIKIYFMVNDKISKKKEDDA